MPPLAGCSPWQCACFCGMPTLAARLRWQNACVGDAPAWAIYSLQRATSAARGSPHSSIAPPWGVVSMHSILHPPRFVKRAARKTNRFVRRQDAVFAAGVRANADNPPCPLYRENPFRKMPAAGVWTIFPCPCAGARQAGNAASCLRRVSSADRPFLHPYFIGDRCIGPAPRFPSPPPPERRALIRAG